MSNSLTVKRHVRVSGVFLKRDGLVQVNFEDVGTGTHVFSEDVAPGIFNLGDLFFLTVNVQPETIAPIDSFIKSEKSNG